MILIYSTEGQEQVRYFKAILKTKHTFFQMAAAPKSDLTSDWLDVGDINLEDEYKANLAAVGRVIAEGSRADEKHLNLRRIMDGGLTNCLGDEDEKDLYEFIKLVKNLAGERTKEKMERFIGKIKDLAGWFEDALKKEQAVPSVQSKGLD